MYQLILTSDGSHTIYNARLNDHYHSIHGAVQESKFIFIDNGFDICQATPLNIFEVGFGTGLNALLTALKSINANRIVNYTSIEKYPLPERIVKLLNYHQFTEQKGKNIFNLIHSSPWNTDVNICTNFNLKKIRGDFTSSTLKGKYDLIYFDAFGPEKQPAMWTKELLSTICSITNKNGVFVTYSVKGEVRRNLTECGFHITLIPGPPGKKQITRAIKI